jgi:hypothetical protein
MKGSIFLDVTSSEQTFRRNVWPQYWGQNSPARRSVALSKWRILLASCCNAPRQRILSTAKLEGMLSSETSVLTRPTWHHIPEHGTVYSMNVIWDITFLFIYLIYCYKSCKRSAGTCVLYTAVGQINSQTMLQQLRYRPRYEVAASRIQATSR